jgi:hypothetical protein
MLLCLSYVLWWAIVTSYTAEDPYAGLPCARARAAAAGMAGAASRRQAVLPTSAADTDVLHYKLQLEIDPANTWIGGTNLMIVRSLADALTVFHFQLDDELTISAVEANGAAVDWERLDFPTVEVTLDRPYAVGEQFELLVHRRVLCSWHSLPHGRRLHI